MKDINLYKKKIKVKSKPFLLLNITTIILLIALVFVSGLAYLISNSKANLSLKLNDLETANMELKSYSDKLQAYKIFEDNVEYKSSIIENIKSKRIVWSETFYKISSIMPEGVYLNSFKGSADNLYSAIDLAISGTEPGNAKLISFTINGNASDYIEISKLLIDLKNIPGITDPWVVSINENVINNIKLLNFTIEVYWNLPLFLKDIKIIKPQQNSTTGGKGTSLDLGNNG
jgi:Tfp pilus assembly protein PilN